MYIMSTNMTKITKIATLVWATMARLAGSALSTLCIRIRETLGGVRPWQDRAFLYDGSTHHPVAR